MKGFEEPSIINIKGSHVGHNCRRLLSLGHRFFPLVKLGAGAVVRSDMSPAHARAAPDRLTAIDLGMTRREAPRTGDSQSRGIGARLMRQCRSIGPIEQRPNRGRALRELKAVV